MKEQRACHHYLVRQNTPYRELRTVKDVVCFHVIKAQDGSLSLISDFRHPGGNGLFDLGLRENQKALIKDIHLTWCTNDTGRDLEFTIKWDTDAIKFSIPHSVHGETNTLIYQTNLLNLGLDALAYAGLEDSISQARSFVVSWPDEEATFDLFKPSDPFVVFLLQNVTLFKNLDPKQDIAMSEDVDGKPLYRVSRRAVRRVREFFKNTFFPLFKYCNRKHLQLEWDSHVPDENKLTIDDGFAMLILGFSMTCIIVEQGMATAGLDTTRIA
jgi:hypothetical protein